MPNHDVALTIGHPVNLSNTDSTLTVRKDGKLLGRLQFSTGTVDWVPANFSSKFVLTWSEFDQLMQDNGQKKVK